MPLVGLALLQGVVPVVHGVLVPEVAEAAGLSLCGVVGEAVPVELFGLALSWVLDGVAGVDGLVVVVVVVLL